MWVRKSRHSIRNRNRAVEPTDFILNDPCSPLLICKPFIWCNLESRPKFNSSAHVSVYIYMKTKRGKINSMHLLVSVH